VVNICLPVGTVINLEGAALYEGSATVMLAVLSRGELTFSTSFMLGNQLLKLQTLFHEVFTFYFVLVLQNLKIDLQKFHS
jgi:hypothetical protein